MQSVVLIAPRGYGTMGFTERIPADYRIEVQSPERVLVRQGSSYAAINRESRLESDFGAEDLSLVRQEISDPEFFTLEFNDYNLVRALLLIVGEDGRILIDNDHGVRLRGPQFVALLRAKPGWDWRRE
jgi:hypothetical protein